MWTPETRSRHDRDDLRYTSDLTDAEWQVLEPFFPPPAHTGRHRAWPTREVVNAIFYILRGGVPWRMLPKHFPPHQTTYRWFVRFRDSGLWESINHHLVMLDRERVDRAASPTAYKCSAIRAARDKRYGKRAACPNPQRRAHRRRWTKIPHTALPPRTAPSAPGLAPIPLNSNNGRSSFVADVLPKRIARPSIVAVAINMCPLSIRSYQCAPIRTTPKGPQA
jgi:transposase